MNTYVRASWSISALVGVAAGVVYFLMSDRLARIESTGEPKLEMPTWWMAGESLIVCLLVTLLVVGISAGARRIWCGKEQTKEANLNTRPDDPFGLDQGVTPQSIGGGLFQIIGRIFRKH